jgi:hypothetical protein
MKKNYRVMALALLLGSALLTGCKKDEELSPAEKQEFVSAQATVEVLTEIQSLNSMVTSLRLPTGGNPGGRIAGIQETTCGVITTQTSESTGLGTITLDFGTGTTCNGRLFKGKIAYTIGAGSSENTLYQISARFDGYEADGKKLDGNYVIGIGITKTDNSFVYTYKYNFTNAVLTYKDGTQVKWNSSYDLNMKINVSQTNSPATVDISVTGGVTGTTRTGSAFSANVTSPLIVNNNCQKGYTKGTYLIKVAGHPDALLDFGNGACDDVVMLIINGKSQQITMQP